MVSLSARVGKILALYQRALVTPVSAVLLPTWYFGLGLSVNMALFQIFAYTCGVRINLSIYGGNCRGRYCFAQ